MRLWHWFSTDDIRVKVRTSVITAVSSQSFVSTQTESLTSKVKKSSVILAVECESCFESQPFVAVVVEFEKHIECDSEMDDKASGLYAELAMSISSEIPAAMVFGVWGFFVRLRPPLLMTLQCLVSCDVFVA